MSTGIPAITRYIDDEIQSILPLLRALAAELSARLKDDPLFWGVLGRAYEPFVFEDLDDLDARISSGCRHILEFRLRTARADLHDYWESLPPPDERDDDDSLDPLYGQFLSAVDRASGAECE